MCPGGYPIVTTQNWRSAFLPGVYQGTYLDTNNTQVRNVVLGVLCAGLVGLASYQLGQSGVQPSVANVIGAIIAFAGLFRLSVSLNSDTIQTTTGQRPPSLLGPDNPGGGA